MGDLAGMHDLTVLEREQERLGALSPSPWEPGESFVAGAVFVAFARGEQGPGAAGDRALVGAAATRGTIPLADVVVEGRAGAPYRPGFLAAREGALVEAALRALVETVAVDVVLVDATGRDHPRRAGLALHVGAVLDIPTIGVTHRPLHAAGPEPDDEVGATTDLLLDGEIVGCWLRVQRRVRPIAVHAAWRTTPAVAAATVLRVTGSARTPEPLRLARTVAREARAAGS